jgi:hypothetical protein
VTCSFCGRVNDVASANVVAVARRLEQAGIRVPDRLMSREDIEADIARRQADERDKRRTALIVAGVLSGIFLAVLGFVLLVVQP